MRPAPRASSAAPARLWREEAGSFATVESDVAGNSVARLNPGGTPRVMLTGHLDEIGLMVVHIDDEGFVHFAPIGGWDSQVLVGQRVRLEGRAGPVEGVIGKKAIHLIKAEERDKVSKITDLWIDIGATTRAEAAERVRVGDAGVLAARAARPAQRASGLAQHRQPDRLLRGPRGAAAPVAAAPRAPACMAVGTTQEEIAYSGGGARTSAFGLEPDAAVVVDVTHATDYPGVEKKEVGDFKLGSGPALARGSAVSPVVFDQLVAAAEAEKIPFTIEAAPRGTSTDADAIHTSRRGIATGLVSVPCRYMHSPNEMVALDDLDRAAALLAAWARRLTSDTSFIPF